MSFLKLCGKVANHLETPEGVSREGKEYGGKHQVQLLCEETLRNGETRLQLFTLNTNRPGDYPLGTDAEVPVGVFATPKGVQFYEVK